jgi:hypothetical protein
MKPLGELDRLQRRAAARRTWSATAGDPPRMTPFPEAEIIITRSGVCLRRDAADALLSCYAALDAPGWWQALDLEAGRAALAEAMREMGWLR